MSEGLGLVLWVTLKVAFTALLLIAVPAVLLGYLLARRQFSGKALVETLVTLPLVLPPTAVGYMLLKLLAADGPLGFESLGFDLGILLSWRGAVLASAVMAWPLVVRTARVSFEAVDPRLEQVARTLGLLPRQVFWKVSLPLAGRGLLAGLILGFTRALGEFGATVIVAGNIAGETQTLSLAIYQREQLGQSADPLLGIAVLLGFCAVLCVEWLSHRTGARS